MANQRTSVPNVRSNNKGAVTTMASTTPAKRINFGNVGQPVDPGEYILLLESHSWAKDKNGEDRVNLIFRFADDERYSSKKQYSGYSPYGDAAYYLMDALVQLGVDPDELMQVGENPDDDEDADREALNQLIKSAYGAKAKAVIGHTQGKDKNGNDRIYANVTDLKAI